MDIYTEKNVFDLESNREAKEELEKKFGSKINCITTPKVIRSDRGKRKKRVQKV